MTSRIIATSCAAQNGCNPHVVAISLGIIAAVVFGGLLIGVIYIAMAKRRRESKGRLEANGDSRPLRS
jgi:hypothetical protein